MAQPKVPSIPFGFCWTIPGKTLNPDEVRELWQRWRLDYLQRKWADIPFIWRIELQQRKQAHWHCVAWIPLNHPKTARIDAPEQIKATIITEMIKDDWVAFVRNRLGSEWGEWTHYGAQLHACKVDLLKNTDATNIVGYLADHTTKHKKEQLGWQGRQWGIVNKGLLEFEAVEQWEISPEVHKRATRQFRRLQERLRARGGKYTGARINEYGNVSQSLFGRDLQRYLDAVTFYEKQEAPSPCETEGFCCGFDCPRYEECKRYGFRLPSHH